MVPLDSNDDEGLGEGKGSSKERRRGLLTPPWIAAERDPRPRDGPLQQSPPGAFDPCGVAPDQRILAQGVCHRLDGFLDNLNGNVLVVGPSGSGKDRGVVIPNLLRQGERTYVVSDPKGGLHRDLAPYLKRRGVRPLLLDLADPEASDCGWDPMRPVRHADAPKVQREASRLAAQLAPIPPGAREVFWYSRARQYLKAFTAAGVETGLATRLDRLEDGMRRMYRMEQEAGVDEGRFDRKGSKGKRPEAWRPSDKLSRETMSALASIDEDGGSEVTRASVMHHVHDALDPYTDPMVARLAGLWPQALDTLLGGRVCLFVVTGDTGDEGDRMAAAFWAQLMQRLLGAADALPGRRFERPVRLVLNDAASGAPVPGLARFVSQCRSRNVSVTVCVQSLSQLTRLYGPEASAVRDSCDRTLFLGANDTSTLRDMAGLSGKDVEHLRLMRPGDVLVIRRGAVPKEARLWDLERDPLWEEARADAFAAEVDEEEAELRLAAERCGYTWEELCEAAVDAWDAEEQDDGDERDDEERGEGI